MMEKKEWKILAWITGIFAVFYYVPYDAEWFNNSVVSGINLLNEYAKQHVLTCLVPAFFIAGAIGVFIKQDEILKFLGPKTKKYLSYSIASVSGAVLAVCSCTILPLFAGIRKRGAGLGPAITFLFSGPAINIAAIFLTISVLGFNIGIARITAAILISIITGLLMAVFFKEKIQEGGLFIQKEAKEKISIFYLSSFFVLLVGILVVNGLQIVPRTKNIIMLSMAAAVGLIAVSKFSKKVRNDWLNETWSFSKLILPLLFGGVFVAGFIMPLLPNSLIQSLVGQNNLLANLIASVFGAFMYFSTLTEIPILEAFIKGGMHQGPALALLLAGPALSLPNMLVVRGVLGTKKTIVYVSIVVVLSTIAGLLFGSLI